MSFFQTAARNLRCCGTAYTMQDDLESASFKICKAIMAPK